MIFFLVSKKLESGHHRSPNIERGEEEEEDVIILPLQKLKASMRSPSPTLPDMLCRKMLLWVDSGLCINAMDADGGSSLIVAYYLELVKACRERKMFMNVAVAIEDICRLRAFSH